MSRWVVTSGASYSDADAVAAVEAANVFVSSANVRTVEQVTQAEYDAIATKDAATLYVVVA